MNPRMNANPLSSRSLWVFGLFVFCLPLGWAALQELRFDPHVANHLSDLTTQEKFQRWFKSYFTEDEPLIATWENSTLDDPRIEQFRETLLGTVDADGERRGGSPYVASVTGPTELLKQISASGVTIEEALLRVQGMGISRGDLRIQLTDAGRKDPGRSGREITTRCQEQFKRKFTIHDPIVAVQADVADEEVTEEVAAEEPQTLAAESEEAATSETTEETVLEPTIAFAIPPHDLRLSWEGMQNDPEVDAEVAKFVAELRGFATPAEHEGQRLVSTCDFLLGSPVAVQIMLTDAGRSNITNAEADIRRAATTAGISAEQFNLGGSLLTIREEVRQLSNTLWNAQAATWMPQQISISLLAILVMTALLWRLAGDGRFALVTAGLTIVAAIACPVTVSLCGQPFHPLCLAVPGLTATLVMAGVIHRRRCDSIALNAPSPLRGPFSLTVIILCLGMLPLAISRVITVRWFALYAVIGCGVAWLLVQEVYPAFQSLRSPLIPLPADSGWAEWARWTARRSGRIYCVCGLMVLCGLAGYIRLTRQTLLPAELSENCVISREQQAIEERLQGLSPIEIVVRFTKESQDRVRFLKRMEVVRQIKTVVCQHPQVSGCLCLADFHPVCELPSDDANKREIVQFNRRSNEAEREWKREDHPLSRGYLAVATAAADWRRPGDQRLCKPQDELWRITLQTRRSPLNADELIDEIEQRVQGVTRFYAGADHIAAGMTVLEARGKNLLTESLLWGLLGMTAAVTAIASYQVGHLWGGMLASGATLWPIAMALGALIALTGYADAVLLAATIPSLTMTLLGMTRWIEEYRHGISTQKESSAALAQTVPLVAWPQLQLAGLLVAAGIVLTTSDWPIVSRFGWQSAVIASATMLTAAFWFPALLTGKLGTMIEHYTKLAAVEKEFTVLSSFAIPAVISATAESSPTVDEADSTSSDFEHFADTLPLKIRAATPGASEQTFEEELEPTLRPHLKLHERSPLPARTLR